ncbi:MAG TPA: hypothetical protein VLH15_06995 [Dehalococcoidales bacterium]|nr:hypothetical protein [Dehalococcoidales bacterium]
MGEKNDYDQGVNRRLELVRKQFKTQAAEQKKVLARDRRQAWREHIRQNQIQIGRIVLYVVSGLLVTSALILIILEKI